MIHRPHVLYSAVPKIICQECIQIPNYLVYLKAKLAIFGFDTL